MMRLVLELSTFHVPGPAPEWGKLKVLTYNEGFIVFVNGDLDVHEKLDLVPEWLLHAWNWAERNQCSLIHFDGIHECVEFLPRFETEWPK